jgi:plasmid stability protein
MEPLTEEKALALLIMGYGRRRKVANPLPMAEACAYLRGTYRSQIEVSKRIGVHSRSIGRLIRIDSLSTEVKKLIEIGLIQGIERSYNISTIKDLKRQVEVAKASVGLSSRDVRDLVAYVKRHPRKSIKKCREDVLKSKKTVVNLHVIIGQLEDEVLQALRCEAATTGQEVENLAREEIQKTLRPRHSLSCTVRDANLVVLSLREDDFKKLVKRAGSEKVHMDRWVNNVLKKVLT